MKEGQKGEEGLVSFTSRREWEENLAGVQCASENWCASQYRVGLVRSAGRPSPGTGQPGQHPAHDYMPHTVTAQPSAASIGAVA